MGDRIRGRRRHDRRRREDGLVSVGKAGCVILTMLFLAGCAGPYERIELTKGADASLPDVTIGSEEQTEAAIEEGLVIEAAPETGESTLFSDYTILFGGDVMLSDYVLQAYDKAGGVTGILDEGYRSAIEESDFFMVNEEFPFSSRGKAAADKQYTYRLAPERIAIFQEIGIDAVTLANNHALDYGTDALLDTIDILEETGILHTGAGDDLDTAKEPVIVDLGDGRTLAVLGLTRVIPQADWAAWNGHAGMFSTYDVVLEEALEEIRSLKESHDYVAVFVHWGEERSETPNKNQQTLAHSYVEAGADLVIGAHPHVLQGIEYYEGVPIVYSLGNFLFGSSIPQTALLEVTISGSTAAAGDMAAAGATEDASVGKLSLRLLPGTSSGGYTRMLTDEGEWESFAKKMTALSDGVTVQSDGTVTVTQEK